ncbi:glucose 1-dehydrogenase [Streptomyces sp. HNM0574]|uniref:glucose 1-dehydrogenase n=1 Tax=Streptomyces sp. HNM0574 TaxID=2714954 RepID=UPI00146CCF3E|nr:glucose 1-dehydrogenase [Streptomyces sp. HNM0574]NLU68785.1 glucose 1-dehydrogenase [Streptomyces sp. HNM0574]
MPQQLSGKTAIVTGSATGIGFAIASRLAAEGANVVVSDIDEAAAKEASAKIPGSAAIACDVRDEDQVKALVEGSVERFGALHVMVPNAGVARAMPLVEMDLAAWREVTSVNLDGVFLAIRHAAPAIVAAGGGSIVTLGSVTALAGAPLIGHYAASKAAVVNLTKTAATELRSHNVRVNAVLPGFVGTQLVTGQAESFEEQSGMPAGGFAALMDQKQGRLGTVEEVADAVLFLAADSASFCNGTGLLLDGGLNASLF